MNSYFFDELNCGMFESFEVEITKELHDGFTRISGDNNPMHMSDEYARENGYEAKLVYGMLTASFYSKLVGVYLPGEHCLFHEINSTFNSPVYIGDRLTVYGEITELHEVFKRVKIKAYIKNQNGKKVSRATLIVGVNK